MGSTDFLMRSTAFFVWSSSGGPLQPPLPTAIRASSTGIEFEAVTPSKPRDSHFFTSSMTPPNWALVHVWGRLEVGWLDLRIPERLRELSEGGRLPQVTEVGGVRGAQVQLDARYVLLYLGVAAQDVFQSSCRLCWRRRVRLSAL